jgi:hypothetical protein
VDEGFGDADAGDAGGCVEVGEGAGGGKWGALPGDRRNSAVAGTLGITASITNYFPDCEAVHCAIACRSLSFDGSPASAENGSGDGRE